MPSPTPLAIVLAAGKGTRMKSDLPKVLVEVSGRPMIDYVLDAVNSAGVGRVLVVVGHRADLVRESLKDAANVEFVDQTEQLGTGHAMMMCRKQLEQHEGPVLVIAGDAALVQSSSLAALLDVYAEKRPACVIGTVRAVDPTGYGRIVRNAGQEFVGIVEEKDATNEQKQINEINVSTYLFDPEALLWALDQITDDNAQQEYYITDCPGVLLRAGKQVLALPVLKSCEALSINSMADLQKVEAELAKH